MEGQKFKLQIEEFLKDAVRSVHEKHFHFQNLDEIIFELTKCNKPEIRKKALTFLWHLMQFDAKMPTRLIHKNGCKLLNKNLLLISIPTKYKREDFKQELIDELLEDEKSGMFDYETSLFWSFPKPAVASPIAQQLHSPNQSHSTKQQQNQIFDDIQNLTTLDPLKYFVAFNLSSHTQSDSDKQNQNQYNNNINNIQSLISEKSAISESSGGNMNINLNANYHNAEDENGLIDKYSQMPQHVNELPSFSQGNFFTTVGGPVAVDKAQTQQIKQVSLVDQQQSKQQQQSSYKKRNLNINANECNREYNRDNLPNQGKLREFKIQHKIQSRSLSPFTSNQNQNQNQNQKQLLFHRQLQYTRPRYYIKKKQRDGSPAKVSKQQSPVKDKLALSHDINSTSNNANDQLALSGQLQERQQNDNSQPEQKSKSPLRPILIQTPLKKHTLQQQALEGQQNNINDQPLSAKSILRNSIKKHSSEKTRFRFEMDKPHQLQESVMQNALEAQRTKLFIQEVGRLMRQKSNDIYKQIKSDDDELNDTFSRRHMNDSPEDKEKCYVQNRYRGEHYMHANYSEGKRLFIYNYQMKGKHHNAGNAKNNMILLQGKKRQINNSLLYNQLLQKVEQEQKNTGATIWRKNPLLLEEVVFSKLSASALSNHKWRSVTAQRRALHSKSVSPDFKEYPLSPKDAFYEPVSNAEKLYVKRKVQSQIERQKHDIHQLQDDFILNNTYAMPDFLKYNLALDQHNQRIYGMKMDRYQEILKWAKIDPISQYQSDPVLDVDRAQEVIQSIHSLHRKYKQPAMLKKKGGAPQYIECFPVPAMQVPQTHLYNQYAMFKAKEDQETLQKNKNKEQEEINKRKRPYQLNNQTAGNEKVKGQNKDISQFSSQHQSSQQQHDTSILKKTKPQNGTNKGGAQSNFITQQIIQTEETPGLPVSSQQQQQLSQASQQQQQQVQFKSTVQSQQQE